MTAIGYLILALAKVLGMLINLYTLVIAVTVLLSWVNADPYNPLVRLLRQLTEPVLLRVRRLMPQALFRTGLDFSPIITLIFLTLLDNVAVSLLYNFGRSLLLPTK